MPPKSKAVLDTLRDECKSMVTKRAGLSGAAAVLPIPGADIGADVMLLLEMIPMINRKFGLSAEEIDELDPQTKKGRRLGCNPRKISSPHPHMY